MKALQAEINPSKHAETQLSLKEETSKHILKQGVNPVAGCCL